MKHRIVIDGHGDVYSDYILEEGDEGYEENYNEHDSDPFWDSGQDYYHRFTPYGY